MKRSLSVSILSALALIFFPVAAEGAACTWAKASGRSYYGTCSAGTMDAPSAATDGINLSGVASVQIRVRATTAGQTVSGGALSCYLYSPLIELWSLWTVTCSLSSTAVRSQFLSCDSPAIGIPVVSGYGQLACVPSSVTISSGGLTVELIAIGPDGNRMWQ